METVCIICGDPLEVEWNGKYRYDLDGKTRCKFYEGICSCGELWGVLVR